MSRSHRSAFDEPDVTPELLEAVEAASFALDAWEGLDPLIDRVGDSRLALLGEASHGTTEYYEWRRLISQRLIQEKDFSFIAVEGDWPDCYRVNRYVKGYVDSAHSARDVLHAFERWPTWMWANEEAARLVDWLRAFNQGVAEVRKVGFYGLDVYSLWESLTAVLDYLEQTDGKSAAAARRAFECFEPFGYEIERYAHSSQWSPKSCEDAVVGLLRELREQAPLFEQDGREAHFNAEQNALVATNSEHYYRTMIGADAESWNVRDRHMMETLNRLMAHHGPHAKGIVWAHNTHVGDARYTDMAAGGMINIGQLARQEYGPEAVVLLGFSSYEGRVVAGREWGARAERVVVPPGRPGSWEDLLRHTGTNSLLLLPAADASRALLEPRGHRAIGVVYRPEYEAYGNYVPTVLPRRYDALAFFERTHAVHPLHVHAEFEHEVPETFPSGV